MWTTQFSLEAIGIEGTYTISQIPSLDISKLPYYNEKQKTLKKHSLIFETQIDRGSYGNIYLAKRDTLDVLVKQPRMAEMNLLQEAVLQHLAHKVVEKEGFGWSIPKVYDVFWKGEEIWFSMERIYGVSVSDWFSHTQQGDRDTFFLIAQICLLLATLEASLNLDHRDLKVSNLLLKPQPSTIQVRLKDSVWTLNSPFTVILLDFGFACLGSEELRGKPLVNLGDGVLPPMDPCPKEGRDMFHLLVSLLGLPIFREKISSSLHERLDKWLSVGKKSYGTMARRWSTENWSYLVSSQPHFGIPTCCPLVILQEILLDLKGSLIRDQSSHFF